MATGFLGTPLVLPALSDAGHFEEAYRMLLRRDPPSWLYQVDQGATTIWERWDAILPDGSIHPGTMTALEGDEAGQESHMLSFNHYAYGAVIDWVYRNVAGIAPTLDAPGYREVVIAPRPVRSIGWARASIESGFGTVSVGWQIEDDAIRVQVELPFGTQGRLDLPTGPDSEVRIDGAPGNAGGRLGPGRHEVHVARARIVEIGVPTS